jgi:hypothetical protein
MAEDLPYDATTLIGQVRFYAADTQPIPQLRQGNAHSFAFSDTEIEMLLNRHNNSVLLAAADLCMIFGTNEMMVGKVITTQDQVTDTSKLMAQYRANAQMYRDMAAAAGDVEDAGADGSLTVVNVIGCVPNIYLAYGDGAA